MADGDQLCKALTHIRGVNQAMLPRNLFDREVPRESGFKCIRLETKYTHLQQRNAEV